MQFVASTPIALIAIAFLLGLGVHRGLWALFVLMPLGATAAFNLPALGGATIGVADLAAVVVFMLVLLTRGAGASLFGTLRPWQPGFFLTGVMIVSAFSAIFLPQFFTGATEVFGIARTSEGVGIVRFPLSPSTGNITQLFRMMLGFFVFVGVATSFRRVSKPDAVLTAMIAATVVNFVLGWLDVLTYATGTAFLLEPLRTANYSLHITDTMAGVKRMVGAFPEAAAFGVFALAMFGFWLQYYITGPRSKATPWMLAISLIMVLRSTSSSAYLAFVVFLLGFTLFYGLRSLRPHADRRTLTLLIVIGFAIWLSGIAIAASYGLVPPVTEFLDRALFNKLASDSGVERMSWNTQAMINFRDTWGLGAGLGSVRASNWLIASLASIGVLGTLFYIAFLVSVAAAPSRPSSDPRSPVIQALKASGLAILSSAILTNATPDLGIFFFALAGVATGLSRAMVIESPR